MKKVSKRRTAPKRRQVISSALRRRFELRWRELTGERFSPRGRVPESLMLSLATLQSGVAGIKRAAAADPDVTLFLRREQGKDCERQAEIAGYYDRNLNGTACIGQVAVLDKLNKAAAELCCTILMCPKSCPCVYEPRKQLAFYDCTVTYEEGYLLQGNNTWNCQCSITL